MQSKEILPVGAIVQLYPCADGENGPSPSDADQPVRYAVILEQDIHNHNATWVLGYTVMPTDQPQAREQITPGAISRVIATPGKRRTVIALDDAQPEPLAVVYTDEDQARVLLGVWPDIDVQAGHEYRVDYDDAPSVQEMELDALNRSERVHRPRGHGINE